MRNTVVISGGDGFVGSHLSKYLAKKNIDVYALIIDNSSTRYRIEGYDYIHIIEGDLNNFSSFISELPERPSSFFHFAWVGVSPENRKNVDIQKYNIDLTINAVKLASAIKSEKFIFPGSTFEYSYSGEVIKRGIKPSPHDAYGATKISAKYYCDILCKQFDIPFIYAVISGIYSSDRLDNNVITYTISSLLNNIKPSFTGLEQLWDYVYIDDVIEALYLISEKGLDGAFYVIGKGDNCPLSDYIFKIKDIINPTAELGIGEIPYSNDELPMSCVDLSEIQNDTGFVPHVSFEDGIQRVISAMKETRG